jgi:transposase
MAKPSKEHWDKLAKDYGMTADVEKAWKARTDFKAWLANAQVPGQPKKEKLPEKQEEVIHSSGPNKRPREGPLHSQLLTPEQRKKLATIQSIIQSMLDDNKSSG